ncbi:transposase [Kitasatospora sp. P5_F3]
MDKRFRVFDPHQVLLLPPSLDGWLPQDHLARFVADLVDEVLDLRPILADYTEKRGYPPYDPRLMLRLLIYGYTTGVRSSRAIERRCADDEQAVTDAGDKAAARARPKPKAQANFTDPDSRILKNSDGAYIQAYNAQAVVDAEHQVITAADVTTNASDALNYTTMLDQSAANTGVHPKQALVDAGYCSETNLEAAKERQLSCSTDTFMATGRLAHDEQAPPAPRGRIPANATLKERMARKLRTKPGKAAYSRRKAIVEPVFGQIMTCQTNRQLLLRGEDGARGEWRLLAACHNLRKIFRHTGTTGLAALAG